jgi:tetratricopeptide (TPR) repeat protein
MEKIVDNIITFYNKAFFFYNQGKYFDSLKSVNECIEHFGKYELNYDDESSLKLIIMIWNLKGEIIDAIGNGVITNTYPEEKYVGLLFDFFKNSLSDLEDIISKLEDIKDEKFIDENEIIILELAIIYKQKGRIYGYLRKYDDAIKSFNKSLDYFKNIKDNFIYKTEIGDTYRQLGYIYAMFPNTDYKISINNCNKAINEDGKFALAHNTLGYVHLLSAMSINNNNNNHKYIDEAIKSFDNSISLDHNFALPWRNKGYSIFLKAVQNEIDENDKNKLLLEAERCIDESIKLDGDNPYTWQYKGYIEFELKNHNNAITYFDNAIRIKPDFALAWYNKGITFDSIKEYEKAIECFDEAIKDFKKNIEYENEQENKNLIKIDDENRKLASVFNSKGTSLDSLGKEKNYEDAIECFKESLKRYESLNQDDICEEKSLVYFNKGYTHGNLRQYEQAVHDFELALKNLREDKKEFRIERADISRNLAFAYGRIKRNSDHKQARKYFEDAIKDFSNEEIEIQENKKRLALAYNSKGYHTIYFLEELKENIDNFNEKKELEEAFHCFERSLDIFEKVDKYDTNTAYILYNKGYVFYRIDNKNIDESLKCFEQATQVKPDFADGWYSRGVFKYKEGEELKKKRNVNDIEVMICFRDALEFFDNAIKNFQQQDQQRDTKTKYIISTNLVHAWYDKGIVFNSLGQYEEALHCFGQVIEIKKDFAYAYIDSGLILNKFGRFEESIRYFDQALKLFEIGKYEDIRKLVLGFKGISYYLSKQYHEAIKCFDQIGESESKEYMLTLYKPDFNLINGLCKFNTGDYSAAKKEFEKITNENNLRHIDERIRKSIVHLQSIVHLFIGLCFYNLGASYNKIAISEFEKAKEYDSKLAHVYYNLAIVYSKQNDYSNVKEELKNCIKNGDQKYLEIIKSAKESIQKLEDFTSLDWYKWWFGQSKIKKGLGIVLLLTLIAFIVSPLILFELSVFGKSNISLNFEEVTQLFNKLLNTQTLSWLALSVGILIGILFLPALQRFKIAGAIELETKSNISNLNSEMSPLLSSETVIDMVPLLIGINASSSYSSPMPIVYNLQSFRVPLKLNTRVRLLNPIEPSTMPFKFSNIIYNNKMILV